MKLSRIGAAALFAAALLALPASAWGAGTNRNSCYYAVDSLWRDMDVSMDGNPVPAASGPGVALQSPKVNAALPGWLAEYGYRFDLLKEGHNEIPVRVWVAVRGTNTVQGIQQEYFETTATTDITVNGEEVTATPIAYEVPALAPLDWTRRGGPVEFRQGGFGTLPPLPIGPNGRTQQPRGSLVISASIGSGATFVLDCGPGTSVSDGAERVEETPVTFAGVDAPALTCLSGLPTTGARLEMASERVLPSAHAGTAYSYAPAVSYRFSAAYLRSLYDAGRLADGDNALSVLFTSAVDGAGTRAVLGGPAVGPVTVRVSAGGASIRVFSSVGGSIVESDDLAGAGRLNAWTGLPGNAPLGFTSAGPGGLASLAVEGVSGAVRPYGSLYARVSVTPPGAAVNRLSLDCVSGSVTVNDSVSYSELGDQDGGDRGRYTIAPYTLDPFAISYIEPVVTAPTPTPTPVKSASPTPTPTPTVTPQPQPKPVAKVTVRSSKLKVSGKRVSVSLACASAACTGSLSLKTTSGRVLTSWAKYSLAAGKTATVRLTLSAAGRKYLKSRKKVATRLTVKPSSGTASSKKLTLTR